MEKILNKQTNGAVTRALIRFFANIPMIVAGAAIVAMMLHVTADVVSKQIFSQPIRGTLETVTYFYMVSVVFLPLGMVQLGKKQLIVELFTQHLKPRTTSAVDAAAGVFGLIYLAFLTFKSAEIAIYMTSIREVWSNVTIPVEVWPMRWVIVFSTLSMSIFVVLQIIRDTVFAISGRQVFEFLRTHEE